MPLLLLVIVIVFLLVVFRPLLGAWLFTRPRRLSLTPDTPSDWGVEYEAASFTGSNQTRLEGWYIPSRNGAAVVLLHDHGGNRQSVAGQAQALVRAGYGVLLFDLHAHGRSEGGLFGYSAAIDDSRAAIAWLLRHADVPGRIGVMGVGLGGMLAIQAASSNAYVRAVAADSPIRAAPADLPPEGLINQMWRYPQETLYQAAIDRFTDDPRPRANVDALSRMVKRSILFISAGRGPEQRLTRHFCATAGEPKRLWEVPHAAGKAWEVERDAYARELVDFFDHALQMAPETAWDGELPAGHRVEPAPARHETPVDGLPEPVGERTVAEPVAMMIAFAVVPLAMAGLFIPFQMRWGLAPPQLPAEEPLARLLGIFILFLAGLPLHEFVHLLGYYLAGRVPLRAVRLAPRGATLALKTRCDVLISARAYRIILLLPAAILGALPGVAGVVIGSWLLVIWAVWMLALAGSDAAALWAMRDLPAATPVRAHPRRTGCEILSRSIIVQNIDN